MKILFLTPIFPWPLISGGQIRAYNLLKELAKNHQVTLVAYIRNENEKQYISQIQRICQQVYVIHRQHNPWQFQSLVRTFFSLKPLIMNLYGLNKPLIENIKGYDAIYCECFYLMDKIPLDSPSIYLSEQNIEYLAYQSYVHVLPFWKKIILWVPMKIDILKMKIWEIKSWHRAHKIAVMSLNDKKIIEEQTGRSDIVIVPNGVDSSHFTSKNIGPTGNILFVGNFSWFQNVQAVEWLIKEIFPKIIKKVPSAKLLIVGKKAPKWLFNYLNDAISLNDKVDDIRDIYQITDILLAPLRSGGGTRYKILEAMVNHIPVVTTSIGAEGLDAKLMIIKDSTDEIVDAVEDILKNPVKYSKMVDYAKEFVVNNYDWKIIGAKLEKFLNDNG
ncbi:MAG: glycosyltransferase family 4 protein [Candidatus Gottesmanbacteria bacterium]